MAIGPRLDLRQTQSLVMTPQLRQAIQLLQYSNIEANQFIEDELLKNPLLAHTDTTLAEPEIASPGPLLPMPGDAALDGAHPEGIDAAAFAGSDILPSAAQAPLDLDPSNSYDAGSIADGGASFGYGSGHGQGETDEDWNPIDALSSAKPNLREHLEQQARLAFSSRADLAIAAALIAGLDAAGRLIEPVDQIAATLGLPPEEIEKIRARMMRFDPTGIFARDLRECLEVQLAEKNRLDPAMAALLANLDLLARRDMRSLLEICGVDLEDLAGMIAEIKRLDPKPAAQYEIEPLRPLIPDVLMRAMPPRQPEAGSDAARMNLAGIGVESPFAEWLLEINPETMPRLLIRRGFHARIVTSASRETKAFLSEQLQSASWLVKALESRAQTILRVCAEIVRRQDGFFRHGISHLRPLTLRDIAAEVELHESTVSRVTSNKSIATPRGIFELKFFFTTALGGSNGDTHSAEAVRHRVQTLIGAEKHESILSDDAVARILQKEGIDIARRTVAKYREALRIPGSAQRKREKLPAG
jgi:RNA polymerase sigma-54 factor